MAVQRGDFDLAAQGGGGETDRHFAMQVVAIALEHWVLLEVDHHIEVARRAAVDAGFAFTSQTDAVAAVDPGRNLDRQRLVLLDAAFAMASGAGIGHHLAGAAATRTGLLHREEALLNADLAMAAAGGAGGRLSARLGAATVAGITFFQRGDADLGFGAARRFLE